MKFITQWQKKKPLDVVCFVSSIDVTDQRSATQDPEQMFQRFVVDAATYSELDKETPASFGSDVYPYEDRSEFGQDVVLAQMLTAERDAK